jgi:hypothetical protein
VPLVAGGTSDAANLVTACSSCNLGKGRTGARGDIGLDTDPARRPVVAAIHPVAVEEPVIERVNRRTIAPHRIGAAVGLMARPVALAPSPRRPDDRIGRPRWVGIAAAGRSGPTWPDFEHRLAAALTRLPTGHYLILEAKVSGRYVQFAQDGAEGLRGETQSNDYADPAHPVSPVEERGLADLGWRAPTTGRDHLENHSAGWPAEASTMTSAALAVRTFRDLYAVERPLDLAYDAFGRRGRTYADAGLGLDRKIARTADGRRWLRLLADHGASGSRSLIAVEERDGSILLRGRTSGSGVAAALGPGRTSYQWEVSLGVGAVNGIVDVLGDWGDPDPLVVLGRWAAAHRSDPGPTIAEAGLQVRFWERVGD